MFKPAIKTTLFALLMLTLNSSYADNSAIDCVTTSWDKDNFIFQNTCDYNIYVMYCTKGKKTSGKFCGDYKGSKGEKGSYYTHTFNLKVGKSKSKWRPKGIEFGACKGMTGFGRDFSDNPDGTYRCEEPKRLHD